MAFIIGLGRVVVNERTPLEGIGDVRSRDRLLVNGVHYGFTIKASSRDIY
jgi:hypothetical protein